MPWLAYHNPEIDWRTGEVQIVILRMLWIVCHNLEIDWKTEEVKMTRCLEEYRKQWRLI